MITFFLGGGAVYLMDNFPGGGQFSYGVVTSMVKVDQLLAS